MTYQSLVSVVIATYNRAECITKAIESVLNQTYKNIEIIIIDGSPNNKTEEVVQSYLSKFLIRYVHQKEAQSGREKERNAAAARNKGIKISKGKYIAILDDDDIWCNPKKIEKQVEFLERHPEHVLVGGGAIAMDEEGKEYYKVLPPEKDEEIRELMLSDCLFPHSTVIFKKDAWKRAGGYDENLNHSEDWDLWMRMGRFGKFYNFQKYFLHYFQSKQIKGIQYYSRRQGAKLNLVIMKKYRNDYSNFWKAYLLGWGCYFASFFSRQKWARKILLIPKIKNLFFKRQIYKKGE